MLGQQVRNDGARDRAAACAEAGLERDQPQDTGGRCVPKDDLEREEKRTHRLSAGCEEVELPAVHSVHERAGEQSERDQRNRLGQPDGARPGRALRHLPDLEHDGHERHLAAETGQGLAEP